MRSDISYLGGILDGEGCFSIQKSGGTYRNTIQVANNSVELIHWLHKNFGGSAMAAHKETSTCEAGMVWIIASKEKIIEILPSVIPELIIKRVQASILLEFCTKFNTGKSGRYSQAQYDDMERYHQLLMLANSKGPGSNQVKEKILKLVYGDNNA